MSTEQTIANFIKWCKGRYGLDDETGEIYEPEYGENVELDEVIKEYLTENNVEDVEDIDNEDDEDEEDQPSNKYAIEFNVGCGYWYVILYKDGKQYESYQAEEDNYENISEYIYLWLDSNSNYYIYNISDEAFDKAFPNLWDDIEKLEDKVIPGLEQYLEK